MQDVRVEPVQSKDIGRFVVPALGVTAAVILAGAVLTPRPDSAEPGLHMQPGSA